MDAVHAGGEERPQQATVTVASAATGCPSGTERAAVKKREWCGCMPVGLAACLGGRVRETYRPVRHRVELPAAEPGAGTDEQPFPLLRLLFVGVALVLRNV